MYCSAGVRLTDCRVVKKEVALKLENVYKILLFALLVSILCICQCTVGYCTYI
jgi:hypothetical protein